MDLKRGSFGDGVFGTGFERKLYGVRNDSRKGADFHCNTRDHCGVLATCVFFGNFYEALSQAKFVQRFYPKSRVVRKFGLFLLLVPVSI